jgi:hypothetical protein
VLALLEGLARTGAVLIGAMLVAMLIDLAVGWLDPRARYTVTSLALGSVAFLCLLWCALPLLRRQTIVSTAREVDQSVPQLEERWSTVTELAQSNDSPEVRGSQAMIRQSWLRSGTRERPYHSRIGGFRQAAVSREPLVLGSAAALVLLILANFSQARVLLHRFWLPGDNVSLTELSVSPADAWVPKGESLTLTAMVKGFRAEERPEIVDSPDRREPQRKSTMSAKTGEARAFQHSISDVSDSFEYRAQGRRWPDTVASHHGGRKT